MKLKTLIAAAALWLLSLSPSHAQVFNAIQYGGDLSSSPSVCSGVVFNCQQVFGFNGGLIPISASILGTDVNGKPFADTSPIVNLANASNAPAVQAVVTNVCDATCGNLALSGLQTVDSFAPTANSTITLLTAQSTPSQNGPWIQQVGAWTRPAWYFTGNGTQVNGYTIVFVRQGTNYRGSTWKQTSSAAITIDTTATTWTIEQLSFNAATASTTFAGLIRGDSGVLSGSELSGDVATAGSNVTTIQPNAVTNAKAAQMAADTIKCNSTAGLANASDCIASTVRTILGVGLSTDVQVFTASGTWTAIASGYKAVRVYGCGQGGGGGGGAQDNLASSTSGAAAGGSAVYLDVTFTASQVTSPQTVTISNVANGGAGATSALTAGSPGTISATNGAFGSLLIFPNGGAGAGGQIAATNSGGGSSSSAFSNGVSGSGATPGAISSPGQSGVAAGSVNGLLPYIAAGGGAGGTAGAAGSFANISLNTATGGASGGGVSTTTGFAGGTGGRNQYNTGGAAAGTVGGGAGGNGTNPAASGGGTSGGGGGGNAAGVGGNAGTSGYCAGGSGGGSGTTGGGAGANGGQGYEVIITYF